MPAGPLPASGEVVMRERAWRWAPLPLPWAPTWRELREQRREEGTLRAEIRWIWNEFCSEVDLTHRIVPTGFATREPPRLGDIVLGPPTHFAVELRPGQLPRDLLDAGERLAAAFEVDDIAVRRLRARWVDVELVEYDGDDRHDGRQALPPVRHFPRRRHRGRAGGPRSAS